MAGKAAVQRATSILDRHVDFGNVYGTRRLRWNTTALYDLPFGRGKTFGADMSRAADLVVGGWRLSSILTVQTGPYETPYFPNGQGDPSGTGSGLNGAFGNGTGSFDGGHRNQHADQVTGVSVNPSGQEPLQLDQRRRVYLPRRPNLDVGNACTTGAGYTPTATGSFVAAGPVPLPIGRFGNSQVGTVEGPACSTCRRG